MTDYYGSLRPGSLGSGVRIILLHRVFAIQASLALRGLSCNLPLLFGYRHCPTMMQKAIQERLSEDPPPTVLIPKCSQHWQKLLQSERGPSTGRGCVLITNREREAGLRLNEGVRPKYGVIQSKS